MSEIFYFKVTSPIQSDSAFAADITTPNIPCRGHAGARFSGSVAGLVDAGGIDQTVHLYGSIDGTNFSASLGSITFDGATQTKFSGLIDIRGYNFLRLIYSKNGATAGAVSVTITSLIG